MTKSTAPLRPFDHFQSQAWPHRFKVTLEMSTIAGGVPTDPNVAEGWLKTKLGDPDDLIREAVAKTMVERGIDVAEATELVNTNKHLNGFKRDTDGLYIEGRQLKAAIKEAVNIAVASGKIPGKKWGLTGKGSAGFIAEHIVVDEDTLHLLRDDKPVQEPDEIIQRFVHTFRGNGIQYEEVCRNVQIEATILADWEFEEKFWGMLWLTGEKEGLGASRSQGMGRYKVIGWEPVSA